MLDTISNNLLGKMKYKRTNSVEKVNEIFNQTL